MCWLGIRQLTVVGIAEYADIPKQLHWKGIIYPTGIRLRETLGITKLACAGRLELQALHASITNAPHPILVLSCQAQEQ